MIADAFALSGSFSVDFSVLSVSSVVIRSAGGGQISVQSGGVWDGWGVQTIDAMAV
jgi:hypothetical protein